jgi:hypothetical protein
VSAEAVVVDTNVLLIANGQHDDISPDCVIVCVQRLQALMLTGQVVLDDARQILGEYGHKADARRSRGVGDLFLRWLHRNYSRCVFVTLQPHPQREYASFPEDVDLVKFDPADRKFVAVAAACDLSPPILQAADAKWWIWSKALERHGIKVEFLCADDILRFRRRKGAA